MCFKKQEHTIRLLTSLLEKNKQQNIFLAENTFYNVLGQKVWRLSDQRTHLCPWRKKLLSHKTENWALLARSSTVVAKWIFSLYCEQFYQVFGKCRNMLCFTYLPYLLRPEYILALFLFFITFPSTKCPSTLACLPLPHSVVTTNLYKDYILSRPHKFCSFTREVVIVWKLLFPGLHKALQALRAKYQNRKKNMLSHLNDRTKYIH